MKNDDQITHSPRPCLTSLVLWSYSKSDQVAHTVIVSTEYAQQIFTGQIPVSKTMALKYSMDSQH